MENSNNYFTAYGQTHPNGSGNPAGTPNGSATGHAITTEPMPAYSQYSPGAAPQGFMTQPPPRHPSQPMPNGAQQYTPPYTHTPAQHLPMPQMDLPPMSSRTHAHPYLIQQPTAPGISPDGTMPFHQQRPDLTLPRRATVPTSITGYGDPRMPRGQPSIGPGEMVSMVRSDSNQHSTGSYSKKKSKTEDLPPLHTTVPPEILNQCVTSGDRVCLNAKASQDDRFLFDLHNDYKGTRGKGMWDQITQQYFRQTGQPQVSTPRLQMKFIRSVRKNVMLPRQGFEILSDIYEQDERNRYNRILAAFKEQYDLKYDLKAPELECYFVRLGFESPTMDENSRLRRRQRSMAKREQRNSNAHINAARNDRNHSPPGTIWNNSYGHIGVDNSHPYQQQPGVGHVHPSNFDFSANMGLTIEQEESLMVDIKVKYDESELSHDSPDGSTPGSADPNDPGNPMLSDMTGHSRMLPSPNGMLSSVAPYSAHDRNNDHTIKQDPWR